MGPHHHTIKSRVKPQAGNTTARVPPHFSVVRAGQRGRAAARAVHAASLRLLSARLEREKEKERERGEVRHNFH